VLESIESFCWLSKALRSAYFRPFCEKTIWSGERRTLEFVLATTMPQLVGALSGRLSTSVLCSWLARSNSYGGCDSDFHWMCVRSRRFLRNEPPQIPSSGLTVHLGISTDFCGNPVLVRLAISATRGWGTSRRPRVLSVYFRCRPPSGPGWTPSLELFLGRTLSK